MCVLFFFFCFLFVCFLFVCFFYCLLLLLLLLFASFDDRIGQNNLSNSAGGCFKYNRRKSSGVQITPVPVVTSYKVCASLQKGRIKLITWHLTYHSVSGFEKFIEGLLSS